jgi:hypothetical protein
VVVVVVVEVVDDGVCADAGATVARLPMTAGAVTQSATQ